MVDVDAYAKQFVVSYYARPEYARDPDTLAACLAHVLRAFATEVRAAERERILANLARLTE